MLLKKEPIMKNARTAFLAILTAAFAVPALADTSVTREQVKAEYLRALKAGELDFGREFVTPPAARQGANTTAASAKIEDLAPTSAGNREVAKSAAVASGKTAT